MTEKEEPPKPDFRNGFPIRDLSDGSMTLGRVDGEDALLARRGDEFFAVGAFCTHYHGPLADGLMVEDTVRCPWHHACFSLRSGEALRAPALDPVACWRVERVGDKVFVREKLAQPAPRQISSANAPSSVVIVGGGGAGLAAADMLRREGYDGPLTMVSADESAPYDRPNLSKDYLAGTASEDWIPLRPPEFYASRKIELQLNSRVVSVDVHGKRVQLENGKTHNYGTLLVATGADPAKLPIEGAKDSHYLRTFADSRAIIGRAASAKRVVVVGASFIALECAASLRTRGIDVHVVAPEKQPLERVLGPEFGGLVRGVHEAHGVVFHLGETVSRMDGRSVRLSGGTTVEVDFLILGVGVRPSLKLAEQAGLTIDRGIVVDEYLQTSMPGIFAAGDVVRWPDPHSREKICVQHWVVAERQGQVAAKNILGQREKFNAVPFFWSQHYDLVINYIGYAERWDTVKIEGNLEVHDCAVFYQRGDRTLAVATVSRDLGNLRQEAAMESRLG